MYRLKDADFPAAYPYATKKGAYYIRADQGVVMLYEYKPGSEPDLNKATVGEMAQAIAKLACIKDYRGLEFKKNVINVADCKALIGSFPSAKYDYADVFVFFEQKLNELIPVLQLELPKGIVHGDAFANNTIFNGDKLSAIIDFEEACVDNLLFDVAMTINGFCFKGVAFDLELALHFVERYHEIRPLEDQEFDCLTEYIQWAALGMASWHLRFDMLNTYDEKQVDRVRELLQMVINIDENKEHITKSIQSLKVSVS